MFSETVKATRRRLARAALRRSLSSKASLEGLNILRRRYYGNERVKTPLSHHCWVAKERARFCTFTTFLARAAERCSPSFRVSA